MIRALLRLMVVVVVVVAIAAFYFGYWSHGPKEGVRPIGTSGERPSDITERARDTGGAIGERVGEAAGEAGAALSDAGLTAKITSKMALDDMVRARDIRVSTTNRVATLNGTVRSSRERNRAVQLARETAGITQVIDHLAVQ
jgi:hyperosmotically inducible periplasmic protein